MTDFRTIKTWPNDAVIEAVEGKLLKTYEVKNVNGQYGPKTVQNAELVNASGDKLRLVVWEHPDLKTSEGKDVVIHSTMGKGGKLAGVKVRLGSYVAKKDSQDHKVGDKINTFEVEVGKSGAFQLVEVYKANSGQSQPNPAHLPASEVRDQAAATNAVKTQGIGHIHGATVGMAINLAAGNMTARGEELDAKKIYVVASELVKVALHMEAGNLHQPKSKEEIAHEKLANVDEKKGDEDVPY